MATALARSMPGPVDEIGDDERFRVYSRMEIAGLLRAVGDARELVTVQFGGANDFLVTAVLGVDLDAGVVVLDYGADEAAMQRLLRSERLRFSTQLDHVRVTFQASAAQKVAYDDGPAFVVALPAVVMRMQRRDAYRLKIPMGRPLMCRVPVGSAGATAAIRVRDICVGGVGLTDYGKDVPVATGTVWTGCRIELPGLGTLVGDLEVMHTAEGDVRRCGCRFRALPLPMANLIQRYITRVEREQHAVR